MTKKKTKEKPTYSWATKEQYAQIADNLNVVREEIYGIMRQVEELDIGEETPANLKLKDTTYALEDVHELLIALSNDAEKRMKSFEETLLKQETI